MLNPCHLYSYFHLVYIVECGVFTPILTELHWLPLEFGIQCRLVVLAFRLFEGALPPCLSSVSLTCQPSHVLRSSSEKLLKIPRVNLKSASESSFHFAARTDWISLPSSVCNITIFLQFKAYLKMNLFRQAFPNS